MEKKTRIEMIKSAQERINEVIYLIRSAVKGTICESHTESRIISQLNKLKSNEHATEENSTLDNIIVSLKELPGDDPIERASDEEFDLINRMEKEAKG